MAAMPWKFESSYPHHVWGCSSVDRALRSHRRGRGFESHQLHQKNARGWALFYCVHQKYIDKRAHRAVVYFTDFLSSGDMAEW